MSISKVDLMETENERKSDVFNLHGNLDIISRNISCLYLSFIQLGR